MLTAPRTTAPTPSSARLAAATPDDVTRDAAQQLVPAAAASTPEAGPARTPAPLVDYADPHAVAAGYLTTRLTYRHDDLAGYRTALTAPAFTTPAFAARSEPNAAALTGVQTAQETSAVQVGAAEPAHEAPHTATTKYVSVACTTTTTYRNGGGTAPATWTLRLVQAPAGQWRVDGVLSTS